jgi:Leucine-rich repeat (LRR) protein
MENLSELDIANNPITNLKTLDKATWKNLNFLSFYDTPVIHVGLNRLKIKKECNMILTTYLDEIRKIQDNSYVFKLEMNTRNILLITELNSIQQLKLRKMMR